jgi:hypothetical protein
MPAAKIQLEKPIVPDCSYPHPPYRFVGRGISLVYEIPFSRVKGAIPSHFDPDPGKGKIWFMVHFHDWQNFYPLSDPGFKHSFFESYYKFSVKYQSRLGDYPLKLYLTSDLGIASGIELYGYPKYPAEMRFELKNQRGRFMIARDGVKELEVELEKGTGLLAKIATIFANATAGSYLTRYTGNFLYQKEGNRARLTRGPTQITKIRYHLAKATEVYLREPLEWEILTELEMLRPKYSFILTDIVADLAPPETIFISE